TRRLSAAQFDSMADTLYHKARKSSSFLKTSVIRRVCSRRVAAEEADFGAKNTSASLPRRLRLLRRFLNSACVIGRKSRTGCERQRARPAEHTCRLLQWQIFNSHVLPMPTDFVRPASES